MSAVINLTTSSPEGGLSGYNSDGIDTLPSFGSISPTTVDGKPIGGLFWAFASHGNASLQLFLEYTGTPPPDDYVTGISFVGDTGTNALSPAFEAFLTTGTSGALYKGWLFNVSSGLPSQSDPFTANGNVYAITVTTTLPDAMTMSADAVSDSTIDLGWTDSINTANNYSLARDNVVIQTLANNLFSFPDTGLSPNTTYDYSITGESAPSNISFRFETSSGPSPLNPVGGSSGQGWNNGNTVFGIAFGNMLSPPSPAIPTVDGNGITAISYEFASSNASINNHIDLIIAGNLTQNVFDNVSFLDANSNLTVLDQASANFSTSLIAGYSIWLWPAPIGDPFPFVGSGQYTININTASRPVYQSAFANATTEVAPVPVPVQFLAALNGVQQFTANGDQLNVGGNVYTYSAGSLVPCNTYTDVTGVTLNPNPITIDVDGFLPNEVWIASSTNTRIRIMDSANNLIQDLDSIPGVPFVPTLVQVNVIDSIFSTDTANAASANAANWVFNIANAAGTFANTVQNNLSNTNAVIANLSSNTLTIFQDATEIGIGNTIVFQNTAYANIAVSLANGIFDVAVFANAATEAASSNSSITIGGLIFQWAKYTYTKAGDTGPFTDDFPLAFPNACLSMQMTTGGAAGATALVISSFTKSSFTWFTSHGDSSTTAQYVFAIGN